MIDHKKFFSKQENIKKLAEKVMEIGKANPDFVYKDFDGPGGCSYHGRCIEFKVAGREPKMGPECSGCIIGQALQALNVDFKDMDMEIAEYIPEEFDLYGLEDCQGYQDTGKSFGEAIKHITL